MLEFKPKVMTMTDNICIYYCSSCKAYKRDIHFYDSYLKRKFQRCKQCIRNTRCDPTQSILNKLKRSLRNQGCLIVNLTKSHIDQILNKNNTTIERIDKIFLKVGDDPLNLDMYKIKKKIDL